MLEQSDKKCILLNVDDHHRHHSRLGDEAERDGGGSGAAGGCSGSVSVISVEVAGSSNSSGGSCCGTAAAADAEERATYWPSIYIAAAISFIGSAQYSLYFSSLWPYLQIIDRSITENFFGYIVAVYSMGQIISSPAFGYFSNRLRSVRPLLFVGLLMMFIGNATYLALEVATIPKRYLLLGGRFITGVGSGNVILLRTYASTASTQKERSKAIAFVTCGQALGLTSGPAFQLLFTACSYPGYNYAYNLHLNMYTAPAYLACTMNALGAAILYWFFREKYVGIIEKKQPPRSVSHEDVNSNDDKAKRTVTTSSSASAVQLVPYDIVALFVCLFTRFTYMFINTNLETLGSPFSMMMFAWTESTAVFYTSLAQGFIGAFTLLIYILWITMRLERYLSFRLSCIGALSVLVVFHLVTYAWPFLPGHVTVQSNTTIWSLDNMDSAAEPVGCDAERFAWCSTLRPVNVYLYYIAYVLAIGLAFPILNITNTTMYADVLGPRRQGTQQGILQMAGGTARLLGPVVISELYSAYGPTMAWNMEIMVIGATLSLWFIFYRRMVPLVIDT